MSDEIKAGVWIPFVPPEPEQGEWVLIKADPEPDVLRLAQWFESGCILAGFHPQVVIDRRSVKEFMRIPKDGD